MLALKKQHLMTFVRFPGIRAQCMNIALPKISIDRVVLTMKLQVKHGTYPHFHSNVKAKKCCRP
jgi:hypothetical protein